MPEEIRSPGRRRPPLPPPAGVQYPVSFARQTGNVRESTGIPMGTKRLNLGVVLVAGLIAAICAIPLVPHRTPAPMSPPPLQTWN